MAQTVSVARRYYQEHRQEIAARKRAYVANLPRSWRHILYLRQKLKASLLPPELSPKMELILMREESAFTPITVKQVVEPLRAGQRRKQDPRAKAPTVDELFQAMMQGALAKELPI